MTAVIFEVKPPDDQRPRYFDIAATLRPLLSEIEGFIAVERFQSLSDGRRILSLYFWRDEAAVTACPNLEPHRAAQAAGISGVFRDYRLRVAEVTRDSGMTARDQAPAASARHKGAPAPDRLPTLTN